MKVLVACEFSGVVRDAFLAEGHDAYSCDYLPSECGGVARHYQCDVRDGVLTHQAWDLMVAHPPCTHLSVSGARWFAKKRREQDEALAFVRFLMDAPVYRIALENPVSVISSRIRKPDQIVQPFHFGDPFRKTTCLWLKNLPKLVPTDDLGTGAQACWKEPPHPDRWKRRSRTYRGIARAMAAQWGSQEAFQVAS